MRNATVAFQRILSVSKSVSVGRGGVNILKETVVEAATQVAVNLGTKSSFPVRVSSITTP